LIVIPAQAGIQGNRSPFWPWTPAFAVVTDLSEYDSGDPIPKFVTLIALSLRAKRSNPLPTYAPRHEVASSAFGLLAKTAVGMDAANFGSGH
jgi:hypothetical protein